MVSLSVHIHWPQRNATVNINRAPHKTALPLTHSGKANAAGYDGKRLSGWHFNPMRQRGGKDRRRQRLLLRRGTLLDFVLAVWRRTSRRRREQVAHHNEQTDDDHEDPTQAPGLLAAAAGQERVQL